MSDDLITNAAPQPPPQASAIQDQSATVAASVTPPATIAPAISTTAAQPPGQSSPVIQQAPQGQPPQRQMMVSNPAVQSQADLTHPSIKKAGLFHSNRGGACGWTALQRIDR